MCRSRWHPALRPGVRRLRQLRAGSGDGPRTSNGRLTSSEQNIAATALFLAQKAEENCRKTKEIIVAVAKVAQKNVKLIIDEQSKEYWRWRDSILMFEEVMLENLTFDLIVDKAHQKLYDILGRLNVIHNKRLRHAAWAFCNDACLTMLPLLMDARDIAIASIFFSSTFTEERIEDVKGEPWWKSLQASEKNMVKAVEILREFYVENPLRKQENPYQGSPEFELENTRRKGDNSSFVATSGTESPRTDRASQSPKANQNGAGTADSQKPNGEAEATEPASQSAPGDSDAPLKAAANDLDTHRATNAESIALTPGKRKETESLASESREPKRRRAPESGDEGELCE